MTLTTFDLPAWQGQRSASFTFTLIERISGRNRGTVTPLADHPPTLEHDATRTIKRRLSGLVFGVEDSERIDPLVHSLRVAMVIAGQSFPLGTYQFADATYTRTTAGRMLAASCVDRGLELSEELSETFSVAATTNIGVALRGFLEICGITDYLVDGTAATAGVALTYPAGTPKAKVLAELASTGAYLCLAPETKILTTDLRWKPAGDLYVGDEIVGFDEAMGLGQPGQRYRLAEVTATSCSRLPCLEISTRYGNTVASEDHLWLIHKYLDRNHSARSWCRTADLEIGDEIISLCRPWHFDDSRDAGYLAGFLDGEGTIGWPTPTSKGRHIPRLRFGQNPGEVLDRVLQILEARGFDCVYVNRGVKCKQYTLRGGRQELLRLLGSIRPTRMMTNAENFWEGSATWGGDFLTRVDGIRHVGVREVIGLGTSTSTMVADGLLSHNSPWFTSLDVLRVKAVFDPAKVKATFNYDDGPIFAGTITESNDLLTAPNRFRVTDNSVNPDDPIVGIYDVPPSAPHSHLNLGRYVVQSEQRQGLTSDAQADEVAMALGVQSAATETYEFSVPPDPRHESFDVTRYRGVNWLELGWSLTLAEGAEMRLKASKVFSL